LARETQTVSKQLTTTNQERTNTMTDTQKLIATEIVKQRMKRVSSETLLSRGDWPMFKASDLKRDIQQTHAIESVLSQLLHDVSKIIKEGGKS
jgi:biotin synthase-related radical SAM superfamily protein